MKNSAPKLDNENVIPNVKKSFQSGEAINLYIESINKYL